MSLGTLTLVAQDSQQASSPIYMDTVSFAGESSYSSGGTTGLLAKLQAATKDGRTITAVVPMDCGGYVPTYDPVTDKLKVYKSAGSAIALAEASGDLSGTTFNLLCLSK